MTNIEANKINKEISDLMILFKKMDSKMAWIKTNDEYKYFLKEEIEILQCELNEAYEYTENNLMINLSKLKQNLKKLEEHKNLLNNVNNLEEVITKFWYKFFWKFRESSKDAEFLKWKNKYLDYRKKPFENLWKVSKLDVNEINDSSEFQNKAKSNQNLKLLLN